MKKFALSFIALAALSGAAFAAADDNVRGQEHNPQNINSVFSRDIVKSVGPDAGAAVYVDDNALSANASSDNNDDLPNYIDRRQLR